MEVSRTEDRLAIQLFMDGVELGGVTEVKFTKSPVTIDSQIDDIAKFAKEELGLELAAWQIEMLQKIRNVERLYLDLDLSRRRGGLSSSRLLQILENNAYAAKTTARQIYHYSDVAASKPKPKPAFSRFTEPDRRRKNGRK
jgi:hypothetical protein